MMKRDASVPRAHLLVSKLPNSSLKVVDLQSQQLRQRATPASASWRELCVRASFSFAAQPITCC
jgi:hypothetical protein